MDFGNGDFAVFNDTSTNPVVNLTGSLQPGSVTVDAINNYTFGGAGKISGALSLTKTNSGALIILTANDYNGVTTIAQGTVQLGNGIYSGALGNSSIVDNGLLLMQQPASSTLGQHAGMTVYGPRWAFLASEATWPAPGARSRS